MVEIFRVKKWKDGHCKWAESFGFCSHIVQIYWPDMRNTQFLAFLGFCYLSYLFIFKFNDNLVPLYWKYLCRSSGKQGEVNCKYWVCSHDVDNLMSPVFLLYKKLTNCTFSSEYCFHTDPLGREESMFTWQNAILSYYEVTHYRYRLNILTMIFSGLPLSTCIQCTVLEVCSDTVVTRHLVWFMYKL